MQGHRIALVLAVVMVSGGPAMLERDGTRYVGGIISGSMGTPGHDGAERGRSADD